jgi:hypothetical protein
MGELRQNQPLIKRGIHVSAAICALLASIVTFLPSPASAVDINGIVNMAIAINYARLHGRAVPAAGATSARRGNDSDDDGDSDSGNRKSADAPTHRSATPVRRSMEASSGDPADQMTALSRSQDR